MAYLRLMKKASCNHEELEWVAYDAAYWRQVANMGSLDWGAIDPLLYNEYFAGKTKPIKHCSTLCSRHPFN